MPDREKVLKGLECCQYSYKPYCDGCPYAYEGLTGILDCTADLACDVLELLKEQEAVAPLTIDDAVSELIDRHNKRMKEQELPTELKQKMWNALYAEEDEYEKKFVGKEEHLNWFTVYRPWLQKGFDIAINAIADWEGR